MTSREDLGSQPEHSAGIERAAKALEKIAAKVLNRRCDQPFLLPDRKSGKATKKKTSSSTDKRTGAR